MWQEAITLCAICPKLILRGGMAKRSLSAARPVLPTTTIIATSPFGSQMIRNKGEGCDTTPPNRPLPLSAHPARTWTTCYN